MAKKTKKLLAPPDNLGLWKWLLMVAVELWLLAFFLLYWVLSVLLYLPLRAIGKSPAQIEDMFDFDTGFDQRID